MSRKTRMLVLNLLFLLLIGYSFVYKTIEVPQPANNYDDNFFHSNYPWNLNMLNIPQAWNLTTGKKDVVVAVIDSGIDMSHPHLKGKIWNNTDEIPNNNKDDDQNGYIDDIHGWDFREDDNDPSPGHWHGTFVSSLIVGHSNNNIVVGVAPNISIMNIRFLDDKNSFYSNDWKKFERALLYAFENGADIINLSIFSFVKPPSSFYDVIKKIVAHNVIIVGITGNLKKNEVTYPAKYPEVIAVTSINAKKEHSIFANSGPETEFSAPGENITGSVLTSPYYKNESGTSFAAPHITGIIALMLSIYPNLTVNDIRSILIAASSDLGEPGKDPIFGYGVVDAYKALSLTEQLKQERAQSNVTSNNDFFNAVVFIGAATIVFGSIFAYWYTKRFHFFNKRDNK